MITLDAIQDAAARIAPHIVRTPLIRSQPLSDHLGTNVYLKLELFQTTGSFKPRGSFNRLLQLAPDERARGTVAVSGGNHAQAVAYVSSALGVRSLILMPTYTPQNYLDATRALGGDIELDDVMGDLFRRAEAYAAEGRILMHPFDDEVIAAGYGTVGLEIVEDVPHLTDVFISVGGGGLMASIATAVKTHNAAVRVWSVETEGADALARALAAGTIVEFQPTSLARTLGAPYAGREALRVAQTLVEQHLLVTDRAAYFAQRRLMERAKIVPELAASCTLAAAETVRDRFTPDDHVVLVICGGNVSLDNLIAYHRLFEGTAAPA